MALIRKRTNYAVKKGWITNINYCAQYSINAPLYDGKDYFTIYDFVKAHHNFADPEWDGVTRRKLKCAPSAVNPLCVKSAPVYVLRKFS